MTASMTGEPIVNKARLSETTWLYDENNKYIENLSKYVGFITNTNTKTAEPWQVSPSK